MDDYDDFDDFDGYDEDYPYGGPYSDELDYYPSDPFEYYSNDECDGYYNPDEDIEYQLSLMNPVKRMWYRLTMKLDLQWRWYKLHIWLTNTSIMKRYYDWRFRREHGFDSDEIPF